MYIQEHLFTAKVVFQTEFSSSLFDHLSAFPHCWSDAMQQLDIRIFFYTARCSSVIAAVQKACSCMHWIPHGMTFFFFFTCVQGQCWETQPVQTGDSKDLKQKRLIMFKRLHLLPLQCLQTLNAILIHENPTLFYICVDPGVVSGGLSVRPVLRSLWMERSLNIFSQSRSWGEPPCAD